MKTAMLSGNLRYIPIVFILLTMLFFESALIAVAPVISNVTASQRTDGSKIMDIHYDLYDADADSCTISIQVSANSGVSYDILPSPANLSGDVGADILSAPGKHILWNAGAEGISFDGSQYRIKVIANEMADLTTGLVAYYPLTGNANDESGNGANGIINGAVLSVDRFGQANRCYYFNGSGAYISSTPNLPIGNSPRSVSVWFKTTSTSGSGGWYFNTIVCWGHCWAQGLYMLGVYQGLLAFSDFYINEFIQTFVSDGNWHHTVVVFDGTVLNFYLDGQLLITANHNFNTAAGNLYIGRRADEWSQFMNGSIDDVRIYNRVLDESEIQALYNEGGWTGNP